MSETQTVNNSLVFKPWGWEWLLYRNKHLAIWKLHINYDQQTSQHSHLEKKSGLIVTDGIAKVSFINNSTVLKGLDKIEIFAKRLHSTKALSLRGCDLLEVESPENKTDLYRFSDAYGREGMPYETKENYLPLYMKQIPDDCKSYSDVLDGQVALKIFEIDNKNQLKNRDFEDVWVCLDGGLLTPENMFMVAVGDVISASNMEMLIEKLSVAPETIMMLLSKND